MNHTGPYHPWVDDPPTPTWFNGTKTKHLKNVFQTWVLHDPRPVESLEARNHGRLVPRLSSRSEPARPGSLGYLIQNTLWWIGTPVSTVFAWIRGSTCQTLSGRLERGVKREFPNFKVVGEVKDGDVVHTSFFQGGTVRFDGVDSGLDSLLDFPLFYPIRHAFAEGKPSMRFPKTLAKDYLYTNLRFSSLCLVVTTMAAS